MVLRHLGYLQTIEEVGLRDRTSAPIGALKCRPTDRPTNHQPDMHEDHRKVKLALNLIQNG